MSERTLKQQKPEIDVDARLRAFLDRCKELRREAAALEVELADALGASCGASVAEVKLRHGASFRLNVDDGAGGWLSLSVSMPGDLK